MPGVEGKPLFPSGPPSQLKHPSEGGCTEFHSVGTVSARHIFLPMEDSYQSRYFGVELDCSSGTGRLVTVIQAQSTAHGQQHIKLLRNETCLSLWIWSVCQPASARHCHVHINSQRVCRPLRGKTGAHIAATTSVFAWKITFQRYVSALTSTHQNQKWGVSLHVLREARFCPSCGKGCSHTLRVPPFLTFETRVILFLTFPLVVHG